MEVLGFDIPLWLVFGLIALYLSYRYFTSTFGTFKRMGVPGPRPYPVLGTVYLMFRKNLMDHDMLISKKYGPIAGLFNGRNPCLMISDPEALKQVMVKSFSSFRNREQLFKEPPFDYMLTMLEDDDWKYVRNHVSPSFSGQKLRRMMPMLNRCAETLINNLRVPAKAGDAFEAKDYTGSFTMDCIASTAFSIDIDSKNDKNNKFVTMAKEFLDFDNKGFLFMLIFMLPSLQTVMKCLGISILNKEATAFFLDIVKRSIKDREENPGKGPRDFLQMLLEARADDSDIQNGGDKLEMSEKPTRTGLTEKEVLSQAIMFFVGGYENIALSISWTMYSLALNPDCQEKAYQEIIDVIGQNEPDYDNIKNLPYLDMCIAEAMRLYPLGFRVDRVTSEDTTVQGISIPKGMTIAIPVYVLHLDPEVWPDPQKYDPERFTEEARSTRHEFSYQPFGMGPRNCVAKRLAELETKFAMVHLLRAYKFVPCDKTISSPPVVKQFKMEPEAGIWLKAESRD